MKSYRVYQIDAFTQARFQGNPAGVVANADGLSDPKMQAVAHELNNAETAFILSPTADDHDVWVRFFTPTTEVPTCGHATISAHYVRAIENSLPSCTVLQRIGIGILPVDIIKADNIVGRLKRSHFLHAQSHQNDPLGCAAANAVLTTLQSEGLVAQGAQMGQYLLDLLLELKNRHPVIREIRGRGLMLLIEFESTLDPETVTSLHSTFVRKGYIVAKRPGLNALRLDPPLIITRDDIDAFISTLRALIDNLTY